MSNLIMNISTPLHLLYVRPTLAWVDLVRGKSNPVLVFDGDCGFCTSSANWVRSHLSQVAEVVAWQMLGEQGLADIGLGIEQASAAAWWVEPGGGRFEGGDAIGKALEHCRRPWRWLGTAILLPPGRWLARRLYPIIARNRHRLPGATPACRIDSKP
jgi:predicted DCC family thiol-disulfide oxidoreductase YuxK